MLYYIHRQCRCHQFHIPWEWEVLYYIHSQVQMPAKFGHPNSHEINFSIVLLSYFSYLIVVSHNDFFLQSLRSLLKYRCDQNFKIRFWSLSNSVSAEWLSVVCASSQPKFLNTLRNHMLKEFVNRDLLFHSSNLPP